MLGDVVAVDGLVIEDECAVRVVREREQNGHDPAKTVRDAVEIGARVLDREQTGANAEFVKTEFEKASREVQHEFTEHARTIYKSFEDQFAAVFGEQDGQLAKELERRFGDGSAVSVQNRIREALNETLAKSREDLVRQFSSSDERNPLADFKTSAMDQIRQAAVRSDATQRALLEKMAELERQMQALRLEKEKLEELDAERERGTAKGREFEEAVAEAVDAIALTQGDVAEAVGDQKEATGKVGDIVVAIDACNGPARGRIVIEAKDSRLSKPKALEELDRAIAERSADFAVLVVPDRRGAAGEAGAAARVQRRQDGRRARPGRRAASARVRLPHRAGAGAHEALGRRWHRRRGRSRRRRAGACRAERRAQDQEPAHRRQDRDRQGVRACRGDVGARAGAATGDRRAGAARGRGPGGAPVDQMEL